MAAHVVTPTIATLTAKGSVSVSHKRQRVCVLASKNRYHPSSSNLKSPFLGQWRQYKYNERSKLGDLVAKKSSCRSPVVVARLFGPAIFEASKLKVLFLGDGKDKRPDELPRAYTLTHSDITAKLTLAVSQNINKAQIQGWYNRLQRDEVLAEWKKSQGSMSLHVHCHISGGHWLLDAIANLRFYIFRKELPVVLQAFRYGDENLFKSHPELEEGLVWVYFHSNVKEFNRVECWGPLCEAAKGVLSSESAAKEAIHKAVEQIEHDLRPKKREPDWKRPIRCPYPCECCFPPLSVIPLPPSFEDWEGSEPHQEAQQAS